LVLPLSLDELDSESDAFDARVLAAEQLDRFCSSTHWILPAAHGLMPPRNTWLHRGEHGYVALMRTEHAGNAWLEPLEAMWGLACPIIGQDEGLVAEPAGALRDATPDAALMLCGLMRPSRRFELVARALAPRYHLRLGPPARRFVASLEGGLDGFLARRTKNFRRALLRAVRRAADAGVEFVSDPSGDYERLLAVEQKSWKSQDGVGIIASEMVQFYRLMVPRLVRRGALRLCFARIGGEDVAYILGGVLGDTYRGLQFSYAAANEALSLGNVCQYHQIAALAAEPAIRAYDLGSEVDYKRRWGEIVHETVTLLAFPV
jgi:hypothetical protein